MKGSDCGCNFIFCGGFKDNFIAYQGYQEQSAEGGEASSDIFGTRAPINGAGSCGAHAGFT